MTLGNPHGHRRGWWRVHLARHAREQGPRRSDSLP